MTEEEILNNKEIAKLIDIQEIICKWKYGYNQPECKGCFSKTECDKVVAEIKAICEKY